MPEEINKPAKGIFANIGDTIKVLTILTLLFSIIGNGLYYYYFRIPIRYFSNFSELTQIVAGDLIFTLFIAIMAAILTFLLFEEIGKEMDLIIASSLIRIIAMAKKKASDPAGIELLETLKEHIQTGAYTHIPSSLMKSRVRSVVILILVLVVLIFVFHSFPFAVLSVSFILVLILFIFAAYRTITKTQSDRNILIFSVLFFIGYAANLSKNMWCARGAYRGTRIITKDSVYISNSRHYFIGKTEKQVFIYNEPDSTATVLNSDDVIQIIFKR